MSVGARELVESLYRRHAGAITAALTRLLGPSRLDLVEATVHDAFVAAIERWPAEGTPDNPPGWILTVARNRALDALRRDGRQAELPEELAASDDAPAPGRLAGELEDDELRMMFVACHPALPVESRVALTLRTLCGLETRVLARALLVEEAAVEKRLVRARQRLREDRIAFELPRPDELAARLDSVLMVLYLLFGEGYSAHGGDRAIREELCDDAIRLASLLLDHPLTAVPQVHALVALMLLQASRLRARVDDRGDLVTLAEQDRGRWDRERIGRGLAHLAASAHGEEISEYHLEAGIAACHATAPSFEATDWARIVAYYDRLARIDPSPVIRLNRAIALGHANGPEAGLRELVRLEREPRLRQTALLEAAAADLRARTGDVSRARQAYERAIALSATEDERRLLRRRLRELA